MPICSTCSIDLTDDNKVKGRNKCFECFHTIRNNQKHKWIENNPEKQDKIHKRNLMKRSIPYICTCGSSFQAREKIRHLESKKHKAYMINQV